MTTYLKIHFHSMRKNPHDRILKWEFKEQHLSIVPKSCSYIYIYILESKDKSFWQTIISKEMIPTMPKAIYFQLQYIQLSLFSSIYFIYCAKLQLYNIGKKKKENNTFKQILKVGNK